MATNRILTGFTSLRDKELDQKAQLILTSLTNNPSFPTPTPPLSDLEAAIAAYQQALVKSESGAREHTRVKNQKREDLQNVLKNLAIYVQFASQDDASVILSSGFELAKPRTPVGPLPKPENLKIEPGVSEGTVLVSIEPIRSARGYLVEYTLSPVTPESTWTSLVFSKSSNLIEGLESGKQYTFRVAGIGSDPSRIFSDRVSRFIA